MDRFAAVPVVCRCYQLARDKIKSRYLADLTIGADVRALSRYPTLIRTAIHVHESRVWLLLGIAQSRGQANVAIRFIGSAAGTCISV